jgi:hypothetical protein
MGQVSTEQTVAIIDAVSNAVEKVQPEPEATNYWWLLLIAIIPAVIALWKTKRET